MNSENAPPNGSSLLVLQQRPVISVAAGCSGTCGRWPAGSASSLTGACGRRPVGGACVQVEQSAGLGGASGIRSRPDSAGKEMRISGIRILG